jgi:homoserine O-acetyltransferase
VRSNTYTIGEFTLESGKKISGLELAYCTEGNFVPGKSKVVWVCHALTASADCVEWWPDLIGENRTINGKDHFIICANIPSSCYGSSGPLKANASGEKMYGDFPVFTIRDMVRAFMELRKHLGIAEIHLLIGGSMGGYQCLEWAVMEPSVVKHLALIATGAKESAWGIAIHTAQRIAIEADPTYGEKRDDAGARGLKAARAIGMLTYRNYEAFVQTQSDDDDRISEQKAESYIHYQGEKLVKRFNAYSYWLLTRSMDSHNISRGRGTMNEVLKTIKAETIVIGISSDFLCPLPEQKHLADKIPGAQFHSIDSPFGHDGFLVEGKKIGNLIKNFIT